MLRTIVLGSIIPIFIILGLRLFISPNLALSAALGSLLMAASIAITFWAWRRIFVKKTIALAVSVIVIKYAIIGSAIYWLIVKTPTNLVGFLIGITAVLLTLLVVAVDNHKKRIKNVDRSL